MAHHGVNVNVVYRALLVTPMESRPAGGQEGMHAWESVVIAMVTYWRKAKLRVNISVSVCIRRIPLRISSPPSKGIHFNQRQMQNIKAAVGSNTEGTQSSFPLPQFPEIFTHTGLQPYFPNPHYLFSFQSSTFLVFSFPFLMPKLKKTLLLHHKSVAGMQICTSQILSRYFHLAKETLVLLPKSQAHSP